MEDKLPREQSTPTIANDKPIEASKISPSLTILESKKPEEILSEEESRKMMEEGRMMIDPKTLDENQLITMLNKYF